MTSRIRASRQPDRRPSEADEAGDESETDASEEKGTFSFNMTAGEAEEDR
jgi:hypothetical protein